ncbi:metallophosphoesterase [Novosphingobium fuchskuhlense]|uniref:Metallophosphoesterase n=1 Tax=Novosphingobium fuchskuhlense TaxID=1117702 RepID=A0A124JVE6_9SPHN|nr:phosphodiesterase [Novosphingobium fuchskuhlense]KUR72199.1 metallophosphoesterase [Novosphingobium fuchskuhlense]
MLIAQITDIHLGFEPDSPGEFNRQRLDRVVAELASMVPQPDMLLATGDLIDRGDRASYERLDEALSGLPFPVYYALGNHDERANFAGVFPKAEFNGGFLQYAIETPAMRILVLDTLEEGRHGGAFCEERAAWLTAQLDAQPARKTLIVQHHPPIEVGIAWMNTDPAEPWVARLAGCLRGRNNVIGLVCGHIHRAVTAHWEDLVVATCPSTAPQIALDLRPIDPAHPDQRPLIVADPPAYALHWWNGRELVTHWQTAEEHSVLARYDAGLQDMIQHMLAERPGATGER